ncbi:MAG: hypothetical protein K6T26_04640 [Alicyclobacillus sp.]|nr:hypothetical protein [Alicyclobacillus sp.]
MQGHNDNPRNLKLPGQRTQRARVVSLRAWRAKKRMYHLRGGQSWTQWLLFALAWGLALVSGAFALASCIPFRGQPACVVWTWLLGLVGCALTLVLYVWRNRYALRLLCAFVLCLAFSFVAGLVTVWSHGH